MGQALYQVGGKHWKEHYRPLRDSIIACQVRAPDKNDLDGKWPQDGRVGGKPGELYMTSVACFILAMPNRYLPILQEGKIEAMKKQLERKGRD